MKCNIVMTFNVRDDKPNHSTMGGNNIITAEHVESFLYTSIVALIRSIPFSAFEW
jgi:S-ribosylhomocysteine lyase LuxS involved in autoinducer biosynthesis